MSKHTCDSPLVSVIMPVYNGENHIGKSINSVLNQSYKTIEVVVVNNSSTDKTEQIVLDMSKIDSRVNLVSIKEKGRSVARNVGIEQSKGDYILFLDADDYLFEHVIEKSISKILQGYSVVYNKSIYVDVNERFLKKTENINVKTVFKTLLKGNIFPINSIVFEKTLTKDISFPTGIEHCEDWKYWVSLFQANKKKMKIANLDVVGSKIYVHTNNTSNNYQAMKFSELNYLVEFKRKFKTIDLVRDLKIISLMNNRNICSKEDRINLIKLLTWDLKIMNYLFNHKLMKNYQRKFYNNKKQSIYEKVD